MSITVICPLYKGQEYIKDLNESLLKQKKIRDLNIKYILTLTNDNSEEILKEIGADYGVITSKEFSHSLTREKEAFNAKGDIIVFITQDIIIKDSLWLYKLTKDIEAGICEASFARQICDNKSVERYTRMNNYPKESRIVSSKDIEKLGIMTYFYSDAAAAMKKEVFIKLNGYDGKDLLTNEDMYIAYKLINSGYKIKYCADAEVIHSHEYSFNSLFKRYFDQGVFLKDNSYIRDSGASQGALGLLKFVLKNAIREKNIKVLINIVPNFGVRFIANKLGQNYEKLSGEKLKKYSSNPLYWEKKSRV